MRYAILSQRNECYDADGWCELDALYRGGRAIQKQSKKFLPQLAGEKSARYESRLKTSAAYLNYVGEIVDYFVSAMFRADLSVTPAVDADKASTPGGEPLDDAYKALTKNADLRGTSLARFMRRMFTSALVEGKKIVAVDFPRGAADVASRAQESALGFGRPYLYELPNEQLLDWQYLDPVLVDGADLEVGHTFKWAVLYRCDRERSSPDAARASSTRHVFKVWSLDDGFAKWQTFARSYHEGEAPTADDDFPIEDEGSTTFAQIPLIEICIPSGLWIGDKLAEPQKEHWRRRSALVMAETRSMIAVPVVKLGSEITAPGEAMPAERAQNPARGDKAPETAQSGDALVLGSEDEFKFVEPDGHAYEVVDRQLTSLKDEMFRIAHQMTASVDNSSSTMRRSGASKKEDKGAIAVVLEEYGKMLRDWAERIFRCISDARGEDVVWTARGLDDFDITDRTALVQEATSLDEIDIPSDTWRTEYKTRIALSLVPMKPETQDVVRDEIKKGVKKDAAQKKIAPIQTPIVPPNDNAPEAS